MIGPWNEHVEQVRTEAVPPYLKSDKTRMLVSESVHEPLALISPVNVTPELPVVTANTLEWPVLAVRATPLVLTVKVPASVDVASKRTFALAVIREFAVITIAVSWIGALNTPHTRPNRTVSAFRTQNIESCDMIRTRR